MKNLQSTTANKNESTRLHFKSLPGLAEFIREYHLLEFVKEQLQLGRKLNFPLLRYFESMPEEKLIELSMKSSGEFLKYLAENQARGHIDASVKSWVADQLPLISKDQVIVDDISLVNYIRKQAFLKFIPSYASEINHVVELIGEIDQFILESESAYYKVYLQLQQEKINDHVHFIEKITQTSPSIIYV